MMPHTLGLGIYPTVVAKVEPTAVALPAGLVTWFPLHLSMLERRPSRARGPRAYRAGAGSAIHGPF